MKEIISKLSLVALIACSFIFFLKHCLFSPDFDDKMGCRLIKCEVKGVVNGIGEGKYAGFTIDNIEGLYAIPQSINDNSAYKLNIGDSIIKEVNSNVVKFKRSNKIQR